MRYESIELAGYIGIYNGLSLGSITLDLTRCINNKILIVGPNGSGKSTIISAIHPYPDTNDKFMPSVEARKTLVLMDGDMRYVIKYVHPVDGHGQRGTTKGYIAKIAPNMPPVELNPSGNVTMCRDIIYNEFELDPGFSSLARISNEDRGLVERKPAERKKIVSYIVSSLETYNAIYKSISKKHSLLKSMIGSLSNKIDMIGDAAKLTVSIENTTKQIDALETKRNQLIESIAGIKIKMAQLTDLLSANKYEEIVNELNLLEKSISSLSTSITDGIVENTAFARSIGWDCTGKSELDASSNATLVSANDIRAFWSYLEKQITVLESEIEQLNRQIPSMLSERETEAARLQDKQQQLNSIKSEFNYTNIKEVLDSFKVKSAKYKAIFDAMGLMNINVITKDEYNAAMESLGNLRRMADALTHNYPIAAIRRDVEHRQDIINLVESVPMLENQLRDARRAHGELSQKIAVFTAKRELAGELVNRPAKCKIDTCIYISAALKADREYPESGLLKLQSDIADVERLISDLEKQLDDGHLAANVRKDISLIERELSTNWKFICKLPIAPEFAKTFMTRVLALDPFLDIDALYKYVDCGNMLQEYQILLENIKKYEAEAQVYESKALVIESIISDIADLESKIGKLATDLANINGQIANNKKTLLIYQGVYDSITKLLDRYDNTLIPAIGRRDDLLKVKAGLDISVTDLSQLDANLTKLTTDLGATNTEIKNLSMQKEAMSHSLVMLSEYKTELEKYQKDYMMVEKVRYYSSPSTGVQNVFLSIFMGKILQTANQLLGLLFGGRFMFGNFVINETEFRIPCIGEAGIMHDDISEMSSAEKSMLSLVISFSLLHASSTRYNILELDEADAMLDSENRFAFINLLDQIMQILNVEQVFIISHNPEIDVSACDVINLRANQSVVGANTIWQA